MKKFPRIIIGLFTCFFGTFVFVYVFANAFVGPINGNEIDTSGPVESTMDKNTNITSSTFLEENASTGFLAGPKNTSTGNPENPIRLKIPSVMIDANVQSVGMAKSGNMAVPTNYTDVAWYRNGPLPGEIGSAVFSGHMDNGFSLAGVFYRLGEVRLGDEIKIIREDNTVLHFKVSNIESFDYKSVPVEEVFGTTGPPRITLITCDGAWVGSEKTYDRRLVVTATLKL